jgi:tetratricopeptide (TPR) repeat protein
VKFFRQGLAAIALVALATSLPAQHEGPADGMPRLASPFQPFDRARFEAAARELGATPEQLERFGREIEEFGLARAGDRLLRAAQPVFDQAVVLQEADDPAAALALTKILAAAPAPLLRAHVRYHLSQLFLASDDPERAMEVLNDYLRDDKNVSPLDGEAAFSYAQALAEIPLPELAIPRFRAFLQWFPEASERFRATAHQRIAELERQQSDLHKLADEMKHTRRDLKKQKTDKPVQVDQEHYIEKLNELIEMFEQMEKQSSGPPSGNGPSNAPASNSALPGGEGTVGNLQKRPGLADRWGEMKDRDRQKIEAQVQKDLPPQYRKMLEEYYKKLGSNPSSGR